MSRKRSKPNSIGGQFAPRLIEMLESPAYRALTLSAHRALDRIEIELAQHGGRDNGRLPVTYDDFQHYGISRHQIAPAIRELVALKFIEITKPGRAGNAEFREPNLFRLTYRHTKREEPSHDWRRIATAHQAAKLARQARVPAHKKKFRTPVSVSAKPSPGNRHRNHSAETNTTGHSVETNTTLDISGWGFQGGASVLELPGTGSVGRPTPMLGRGLHRRLGPVLRSRRAPASFGLRRGRDLVLRSGRTTAAGFGLRLRLGFPHPLDRRFEFLDVDLETFDLSLEFSHPLERRLEFLRGRFPALRFTPLALFLGALVGLGGGALIFEPDAGGMVEVVGIVLLGPPLLDRSEVFHDLEDVGAGGLVHVGEIVLLEQSGHGGVVAATDRAVGWRLGDRPWPRRAPS